MSGWLGPRPLCPMSGCLGPRPLSSAHPLVRLPAPLARGSFRQTAPARHGATRPVRLRCGPAAARRRLAPACAPLPLSRARSNVTPHQETPPHAARRRAHCCLPLLIPEPPAAHTRASQDGGRRAPGRRAVAAQTRSALRRCSSAAPRRAAGLGRHPPTTGTVRPLNLRLAAAFYTHMTHASISWAFMGSHHSSALTRACARHPASRPGTQRACAPCARWAPYLRVSFRLGAWAHVFAAPGMHPLPLPIPWPAAPRRTLRLASLLLFARLFPWRAGLDGGPPLQWPTPPARPAPPRPGAPPSSACRPRPRPRPPACRCAPAAVLAAFSARFLRLKPPSLCHPWPLGRIWPAVRDQGAWVQLQAQPPPLSFRTPSGSGENVQLGNGLLPPAPPAGRRATVLGPPRGGRPSVVHVAVPGPSTAP
jgi:hypothetical protein